VFKRFRVLLVCALFTAVMVSAQSEDPAAKTTPDLKDPKKDKTAEAIAKGSSVVDPNTFLLGAEDVIYIAVWHDPDFSGARLIRPDGKISIPIIGEFQAAGTTPVQLGKLITEKLTAVIKDPIVDVSVTQVNSRKYYIQGEVNRPGPFPLVVPTTVLEALSSCGGFRDFAKKSKITILRKGQRIKFNYTQVIKGKHPEQDILLESGDYIIVP
jgi:polysaccharide biosynthesis/export protein